MFRALPVYKPWLPIWHLKKTPILCIPQPKDTQLQLIPVSSLTWFEECTENAGGLPPVRYRASMARAASKVVLQRSASAAFSVFPGKDGRPCTEGKH
jgi:hypothetical protein